MCILHSLNTTLKSFLLNDYGPQKLQFHAAKTFIWYHFPPNTDQILAGWACHWDVARDGSFILTAACAKLCRNTVPILCWFLSITLDLPDRMWNPAYTRNLGLFATHLLLGVQEVTCAFLFQVFYFSGWIHPSLASVSWDFSVPEGQRSLVRGWQ